MKIATIPDDHPYLDAVIPTGVTRVRFPTTGWAPSPLLDAAQRPELLAGLDVVHVHFGYESLSADALQNWTVALRQAGVALVVTVHDLRNPHQLEAGPHSAHLGSLLAAAAAVITLTEGAAAEIDQRWQRKAVVLAHPSLLLTAPPPRPSSAQPVVGLHLKGLRTNVLEPARLVSAAALGATRAGARLRVDLHPDAAVSPEGGQVRAITEVEVHERFDDAALVDYLSGLTVSVLPYRFGTHSGWLELCRDLGVGVVAPDCGYYAAQWDDVVTYQNNEATGLVEQSLSDAVESAVRAARTAPAATAWRHEQRAAIRATHEQLYRDAMARQ